MSSSQQASSIYDDEPPTKNPGKYSSAVKEEAKALKRKTRDWFLENVNRVRARNQRANDLESAPTLSDMWREHERRKLRILETGFLRHLRRHQT
ncbi:hypothetical protein BST61_g10308 [Cercospora zeina]